MYSSSLTSALDGEGWSTPHPGRFTSRERPGTHCIGGWVGPRASLDGCDLCHLYHKLIGFYNRVEKCLLRGTNWVFKGIAFNNCTFCPHRIYVFCIYLRTNSDLCHLQHKLVGFYNRDEKCLLRGTNLVFK